QLQAGTAGGGDALYTGDGRSAASAGPAGTIRTVVASRNFRMIPPPRDDAAAPYKEWAWNAVSDRPHRRGFALPAPAPMPPAPVHKGSSSRKGSCTKRLLDLSHLNFVKWSHSMQCRTASVASVDALSIPNGVPISWTNRITGARPRGQARTRRNEPFFPVQVSYAPTNAVCLVFEPSKEPSIANENPSL